jgi:hypothetical protein
LLHHPIFIATVGETHIADQTFEIGWLWLDIHRRLNSKPGYLSPTVFEKKWPAEAAIPKKLFGDILPVLGEVPSRSSIPT